MKSLLCLLLSAVQPSTHSELAGRLIPADAAEVEVQLDHYSGKLSFASCLDHGTYVEEGQVIATLDLEAFEEAVRAADRALEAAERSHRHLLERQEMAAEQAERTLDSTRRGLEDAKQALSHWLEFERGFERRQSEQMRQSRLAMLQDQRDELAQLESMYREDELTDATEELVLQRARRSLAQSEASLELSDARRAFYLRFTEPKRTASLERAVEGAEMSLEHVLRNQQMEKADAEATKETSELALEKARDQRNGLARDRDALSLKAPRAGILLHGGVDDYRPGNAPTVHEEGSTAAAGSVWFTVATPDRYSVVVSVPESVLPHLKPGLAVEISSPLLENPRTGSLRVERFPTAASLRGANNLYPGSVELSESIPGLSPGVRVTVKIDLPDDNGDH